MEPSRTLSRRSFFTCSLGEGWLCKEEPQKSGKNIIPNAGENIPVQAFPWELIEVSRQTAEELIGNNLWKDRGVFAVKTKVLSQFTGEC